MMAMTDGKMIISMKNKLKQMKIQIILMKIVIVIIIMLVNGQYTICDGHMQGNCKEIYEFC